MKFSQSRVSLFAALLLCAAAPAWARVGDSTGGCNPALTSPSDLSPLQIDLQTLTRSATFLAEESAEDPLLQAIFPGIELYTHTGPQASGLGPLYRKFANHPATQFTSAFTGTLLLIPGEYADWLVRTEKKVGQTYVQVVRRTRTEPARYSELKFGASLLNVSSDSDELLAARIGEELFRHLGLTSVQPATDPLLRSHAAILKKLEGQASETHAAFKVWEVYPGVVFLYYDTQDEMTRTFLRFQEHYESPKFRNTIFSLEEFTEWYKTTQASGEFSYYEDWGGFNFPSHITEPFFDGRFQNLTEREKTVLDVVRARRGQKFYVIGAYSGGEAVTESLDTIVHEVAHAIFFMNQDYQAQALKIVRKLPLHVTATISEFLRGVGYTEQVFEDEIHAYLLANFDWLGSKKIVDQNDPRIQNVVRELQALYEAQF